MSPDPTECAGPVSAGTADSADTSAPVGSRRRSADSAVVAPLPYPPPWMDRVTLARHLSVRPSSIRRLMERGAIPRPKQIGKVTLWNWAVVNRWLLRDDLPQEKVEEITPDERARRIKAFRRARRAQFQRE